MEAESTGSTRNLRYQGGTVTKREPTADNKEKCYTVSFITDIEGKTVCPLCRDKCGNETNEVKRKSTNKVFVNTQNRHIEVFIANCDKSNINPVCKRLLKQIEQHKIKKP